MKLKHTDEVNININIKVTILAYVIEYSSSQTDKPHLPVSVHLSLCLGGKINVSVHSVHVCGAECDGSC